MFWLLSLATSLVNGAPFVTTWNTTSTNEIVSFPSIRPVDQTTVTIDWGDNTTPESLLAAASLNHTYATPGLHNVSISGQFFWSSTSPMTPLARSKLLDIVSWGDGFLMDSTSVNLFYGCSNMRVSAPPNTQPVFFPYTTLKSMFENTAINSSLNWDLKNVSSLSAMLRGAVQLNSPITFTNTQGVTTMEYMFEYASAFNQPFSFDCSSVYSLNSMFRGASSFNSALNLINTQRVGYAQYLFNHAVEFNQPVSFRADSMGMMNSMFAGALKFNQPVNFENMSQVHTVAEMFAEAREFNQPISFSAPNLDSVESMFSGASKFNQPVLLGTQKLKITLGMFRDAWAFNQPITFPTDYVTNMYQMFMNAYSFNQPVNFNMSAVTSATELFLNAYSFNQPIDFSSASNLTSTISMFANATSFNQPVIMAGNVIAMSSMFSNASSFASTVNFASTSNARHMPNMFYLTAANFTQNLASWDTSLVVSCSNFCTFCGLPSFPKCTPCATGTRVNTIDNTTVCNTSTGAPTSAPSTAVPTAAPNAVPTSTPGTSLAPSTTMEVSAAKAGDFCSMAVLLCSLWVCLQ